MVMEKLERDGAVAVLYSPSYGAGWSTWNHDHPDIVFDPVIAQYVLDEKRDELASYVAMRYPDIYAGGLEDLAVQWIAQGTAFRIHEYDGSERIEVREEMNWHIA